MLPRTELKADRRRAGRKAKTCWSSGGGWAIAALKLKDGKLEKVLRDLREQVPQPERDKIKLDAEAAGSVKIDRLDVQRQFDEQAKKLFGDNPIYIAVRDDALFLTGGEGGVNLLKSSLTSKPGIMPPFKLNVSIAGCNPSS